MFIWKDYRFALTALTITLAGLVAACRLARGAIRMWRPWPEGEQNVPDERGGVKKAKAGGRKVGVGRARKKNTQAAKPTPLVEEEHDDRQLRRHGGSNKQQQQQQHRGWSTEDAVIPTCTSSRHPVKMLHSSHHNSRRLRLSLP